MPGTSPHYKVVVTYAICRGPTTWARFKDEPKFRKDGVRPAIEASELASVYLEAMGLFLA